MKDLRTAARGLSKPRWETLFKPEDVDLEVELVPSEMPDFATQKLLGRSSEAIDRDVCERSFVNFRGKSWANEDGTPVENTLDARLEIYGVYAIRKAIQNALEAANYEIIVGETEGASD